MKRTCVFAVVSLSLLVFITPAVRAFRPPARAPLPNFDQRQEPAGKAQATPAAPKAAVTQLQARLPQAKVDFDPVTGAPKLVSATGSFLSGPNGRGKAISDVSADAFANGPHAATKAFLKEHRQLFGHGPEALDAARVKREFVTPHNGLKTVVWEQQLDGVPVFEGVLISHTTKRGELVSISSQFVPPPGKAARAAVPALTAQKALTLAARNVGEEVPEGGVTFSGEALAQPEGVKTLKAPALKGESQVKLVWLPMDRESLQLCWEVILTSASRGEMFRVLIDAQTGEARLRQCLTDYLTNATYRVYTSDSPSPLSPGHPTPQTNQPPLVPRQLLTLPALDTNASPASWMAAADNETKGNNVDAHLDRNADDTADLPRPHGSPWHVFDLPMDLNQSPTTYGNASAVQLFYYCNWMHDRLYQLGFTEAAGNFQNDNFGRGGLGSDALEADAQDGSGTDNANMSTPPDGTPPRMQMYVFTGPTPDRDGDFDGEIVLHEYAHGLSNRRVGGGVGISALQSAGMGEGWSDFYPLALFSEPGDDVDGVYAAGGYATYMLGGLKDNYYFGIRRYPYCTDTNKNPLTFKDIDPGQASPHTGVPHSPIIGDTANEVHNQGEVWCVALWEARANLIRKHGFAGNELILQLVTDGMNLSPANPNFLQARDAILQADLVNSGGANRLELWAAFAKRGMGFSATSPSSSTTSGVREAYDLPDDLFITPREGFTASGPVGGPFAPSSLSLVLTNQGTNTIRWTASAADAWLNLSATSGHLAPGDLAATVTASLDPVTASIPAGVYATTVWFTNETSGRSQGRSFTLLVGQPDYFTEFFDAEDNDLRNVTLTFTPNGSPSFYSVCREAATNFPTVPSEDAIITVFNHDSREFVLSGGNNVSIYGRSAGAFFVTGFGEITFDEPDVSLDPTFENHFRLPRVSALLSHLHTADGGAVYAQELADRVAVTFLNIPEYLTVNTNSFQVEMFFDGRLRLTYLDIGTRTCLVGLSAGNGLPAGFVESDLSSYGACLPPLLVVVPASANEGETLAGLGQVILTAPLATNLTVSLASSVPSAVTVPASVTILAGATNGSFTLVTLDDAALTGTRRVNVLASAAGFSPGAGTIAVFDNEAATLAVSAPATAREGDSAVPATLSLSAAPAVSVLVNLASSDTTEIQVPLFAIIPAGQTSALFSVTVMDDHEIDGPQTASITARVAHWTDGVATLTVLDNEPTNLVVVLPATATEGQGVRVDAGVVRISGTLPTNLVVTLASDDLTELRLPASVTIPAGQVVGRFNLEVVDDPDVDGVQTVNVVASAPAFASGSAKIEVYDNETPTAPVSPYPPHLSTGLPANVTLSWNGGMGELSVNGGFETGDLSGWMTAGSAALTYGIADESVDPPGPAGPTPPYAGRFCAVSMPLGPSAGMIYQDFTVPVGVTSATLSWAHRIYNAASDFASNQVFRVEIRGTNNEVLEVLFTTQPGDPLAGEWTAHSADLSSYAGRAIRLAFVQDNQIYYLNAFLDSVSVQLSSGGLVNTYDVYFGTNPDGDKVQSSKSKVQSLQFLGTTSNTAWSLPLLEPLTTYHWQVVSRRLGQTAGPVWQFTTRGADHFDLSAVPSPQNMNQPFSLRVTARDDLGRIVTNFAGPVSLSALATYPTTTLFSDGFEDGDISDWTAGTGSYTREATTNTAAAGQYSLTLIGGNQSPFDGLSRELPNLTPSQVRFYVRASSTTAAGGYFVIGSGGFTEDIAAFFFMSNDGTMGLYEDSGGWHAVPYEAHRWYRITLVLDWGLRQMDFYVDDTLAIAAIPFRGANVESLTEVDLYNFHSTQAWWDQIEFLQGRPPHALSLAPTNSGPFTNGVWTGPVTVQQPAESARLTVQDAEGHSGTGNDFAVVALNNLSVALTASAEPVTIGQQLAYTLVVSNTGPATAPAVFVINTLPDAARFISAAASQGSFSTAGNSVLFNLGSLAGAGAATLSLVITPTNSGLLTNWAVVVGNAPDSYLDDNFAEITTSVLPAVSIGDVSVVEGNTGTTEAVFPVTLSGPFARSVRVDYATTNSTATAGSDYEATGGTLEFPAGVTSNFIVVTIKGDVQIEANEAFLVNLSAPVNATLGRAQGLGIIVNDDGLPGNLYTLEWSSIASPQYVNRPFPVALTAWDANHNPATNFQGTVALAARDGSVRTNIVGTGTTTQNYPMGTYYHDERAQVIYLASELGGAGRIVGLTLDVATVPPQIMNNWTIRLKHTPLSRYTTYVWESEGWTVVLQTNLTVTSTGLVYLAFLTPFDFNGTDNLMVDLSYNNSTYTSDGYCWSTSQSDVRTLYYRSDSGYGDPLTWSGTTPYPSSSFYTPNVRFVAGKFMPVQPEVTGHFTNGVWAGSLAVQQLGASVTLVADDLEGHSRVSNPFLVTTVNDLSLRMTASTNQTIAGQNVTYTLTVSNSGPAGSTAVLVSNTLPAGANFVSASASQGTVSNAGNLVVFNLGALAGVRTATMSLVATLQQSATLTNVAVVTRAEAEDYLANNTATATVAVLPTASIADVAVTEGNVGTNFAVFRVTLSEPSAQAVTISYATADSTALANLDYLSRSGTLTFNPGATSATVSVPIVSDIVIEPNEVFFVNLSGPVNVFLSRARGVCTILNDDGRPGDLYTLAWAPVASPQFVNRPFTATLTGRDAAGNLATNFNGRAALAGGKGIVRTNTIGAGDTTESFPMYTGYYTERAQVIYLAGELGGAGRITSIALNVSSLPNQILNNWTVRMRHTSLSNYTSYVWESSGWTVVYQTNLNVRSAGWLVLPLTTPFDYNGTGHLMVDFSFNNTSANYGGFCWATYRGTTRSLYYYSSSSGDPLAWSGNSPSPYSSSATPDARFGFGVPVPVQPVLTGDFTNGVWAGPVTVLDIGTNLLLSADDRNGHRGLSNPFRVETIDDLTLAVSAAPDPLLVNQELTYTLIVSNSGPGTALGVYATNTFPASANLVSVTASRGLVSVAGNRVVVNVGNMDGGENATLVVVVRPTVTGTLTNRAEISREDADNYLPNNLVRTITRVLPTATITDEVVVREGNLGTSNAVFVVTLSGPFDQPVQIAYATSNDTASAGSDYAARSGTLIFPPGVTTNAVVVPVNGDILAEANEVFFVYLRSASNAVLQADNGLCIILNDDGLPGELYTLEWAPIPSPRYVNRPFPVTITARDSSSNVASNFQSSVVLTGLESNPGLTTIGAGTSTYDYPMGTSALQERAQAIYLASELGGAGRITTLALDVSTAPSVVMSNWTIRMKHTRLSQYTTYAWETSNWTIVYAANQSVTASGWATFQLTTPFDYNGTDNLMIDFSFDNTSSGNDGYCRVASQTVVRTLYYYSYGGYGSPLTWSGTTPYPYSTFTLPNLRVGMKKLIPLQPAVTGNFVNGVWAGNLTALELGNTVTVLADDLAGHTRTSFPFNVILGEDVSLTLSDSPDPISVGQNLTHTIVVTNTGPSVAPGVVVTNVLPAKLTFASASASQGTVTNLGSRVVFDLGDLAAASSAVLRVITVPNATGTVTNVATVSRADADSYLPNNTASSTTAVLPSATLSDATVVEGNLGVTSAVFTVSLSGPFDQPVSIAYATANGTANAGSDYVSQSGRLTFDPGVTNRLLSIVVLGDTAVEANETFFLNLSSPSNAILARTQGQGLIRNDDGLPGDLFTLEWAPIASPQFVNVPFLATLTARDIANVATNFNGSVALSAREGPARTNTIGTGALTFYYPMGASYPVERSQIIYLAGELGGPGRIAALSLDVETAPPQPLNNWTIRLKHTSLAQYTNAFWESTGWTVVYQGTLNLAAPGWATFVLSTPFEYNGVDHLMVDLSFNNTAFGTNGYCRSTSRGSTLRTLAYQTGTYNGNPLSWSGTTPYPNIESYTPNLRVRFENTLPLSPLVAGPFTNGLWTGPVTVQAPALNAALVTDDLNGHTRASSPFLVAYPDDVGITLTAAPNLVAAGSNLTCTVWATNTGPSVVTNVIVTGILPPNVEFVSASTSQGSYAVLDNTVIFSLGNLPARARATNTFVTRPLVSGTITHQAVVVRDGYDPNPANNSAQVSTTVIPSASILDIAVTEGNLGTTTALFPVMLSAAAAQPVTVTYWTTDGTARAGTDYLVRTGAVVFATGVISNSIAITILSDLLVEPDRNFFVHLSATNNLFLARDAALGTILDDDGLPGQTARFAWAPIGSLQVAGRPFLATLSALDHSNQPAASFSGQVSLRAQGGSSQGVVFEENFESGTLSGWTLGTGTNVTRMVTNQAAAGGSNSLTIIRGSSHFNGIYRALPNLTPEVVSFHVRTANTNASGYFMAGTNAALSDVAIFFLMRFGQMGLTPASGSAPQFSYQTNVWYKVTLQMNWAQRTMDYYVDDALVGAGIYFRNTNLTSLTRLDLYNFTTPSQAWWDEIQFLSPSAATPVAVSPPQVGPFIAGLWTGWLSVQPTATNISLVADDLVGHTGSGNSFSVIAPGDVPVLQPSWNGAALQVRFSTVPGLTYVLEFKEAFDGPVWQVAQTIPGDGTVKTVPLPTVGAAQRFYRLRLQ